MHNILCAFIGIGIAILSCGVFLLAAEIGHRASKRWDNLPPPDKACLRRQPEAVGKCNE